MTTPSKEYSALLFTPRTGAPQAYHQQQRGSFTCMNFHSCINSPNTAHCLQPLASVSIGDCKGSYQRASALALARIKEHWLRYSRSRLLRQSCLGEGPVPLHAGDRAAGSAYRSPARAGTREGTYGRQSSYREGATPRRRSLTPTGAGKDAPVPAPPQLSLLEATPRVREGPGEAAVELAPADHPQAAEGPSVRSLWREQSVACRTWWERKAQDCAPRPATDKERLVREMGVSTSLQCSEFAGPRLAAMQYCALFAQVV